MPRNMSFSLTTPQILARTKTVTRRLGWDRLLPGDVVNAVEKAMGLKKGEHVKHLCQIRIVSKEQQRLYLISAEDCAREGFPGMHPDVFVEMFCKANRCEPDRFVNRIEFEYIEGALP